jgi:hypothetical protein
MKTMAGAFFGRNKAYAEALAERDLGALAAALARNAYRAPTAAEAPALAIRVAGLAEALDAVPIEAFAEGRFRFTSAVGADL